MSSLKTPWFPAAKVLPVRKGKYEFKCLMGYSLRLLAFDKPSFYDSLGEWIPCSRCRWRGLAEKP